AYERAQGRRLNNRDLSKPQDLIAHHPDVRRMLFLQKAIVEGCLSLVMQCAQYADRMKVTEGDEREHNHMLLEILIGIAKTYPSEAGNRSVSNGLQVLGGYGYVKDFPLEQYYRDMRIMAIYEGTTGIQSQDLLGRKVVLGEGQMLKLLMEEVKGTMKEAVQIPALQEHVATFENVLKELGKVTQHLMGVAMKGDKEVFLSDANLYMEVFSNAVIGWQWLKQGIVAANALANPAYAVEDKEFYESKLHTLAFFFAYELPRNEGLIKRLMDGRIYTVLGADKDLLR
ncbi:MAG: acyl-CoA dehydrogenase, partial [Bacteroidota bacterium]